MFKQCAAPTHSTKYATKLRSFALALVVALVGTQIAATLGLVDLTQTNYLTDRFSWLLIHAGIPTSTFTHDGVGWGFVVVLGATLLYYIFRDRRFIQQRKDFFGGLLIGALILAGWLDFDDFDPTPVTSLTFVAPVGATIQYSMIDTGMDLNFGIVLVIGLVLGSL